MPFSFWWASKKCKYDDWACGYVVVWGPYSSVAHVEVVAAMVVPILRQGLKATTDLLTAPADRMLSGLITTGN